MRIPRPLAPASVALLVAAGIASCAPAPTASRGSISGNAICDRADSALREGFITIEQARLFYPGCPQFFDSGRR